MRKSNVLTFVSVEEQYSVYRQQDGTEVFLQHGTRKRLVEADEIDIDALWREIVANTPIHMSDMWHDNFREAFRNSTIDPDRADELGFCADCNDPTWDDDLVEVNHGHVCDGCSDSYVRCADCEDRVHGDDTCYTLHDETVCDSCRERNYSYCEFCDGDYHHDCSGDHQHGGCDCESPAVLFSVPNGIDTLANDVTAEVSLPAGLISDVGFGAIANVLRQQTYIEVGEWDDRRKWSMLSYRLAELGDEWQTREGNFTKRLSRFAYKEFGLKITPEVMSLVGNVAREHSTGTDYSVAVTRDLNLDASDFVHEDSCWWGSYYESRCALKSLGGFGLRSFRSQKNYYGNDYTYPVGRAWVMPLRYNAETKQFSPTFESVSPDAYMVFNGYGELDNYAPARIFSAMTGMTYRKVGFTCDPMYVNNDAGYLVAPEEIAEVFTDGSVHLRGDAHSDLYYREQREKAAAAPCNHFEPCNHDQMETTYA